MIKQHSNIEITFDNQLRKLLSSQKRQFTFNGEYDPLSGSCTNSKSTDDIYEFQRACCLFDTLNGILPIQF